MRIDVYNNDVLLKTYNFDFSSQSENVAKRYNNLGNSYYTEIYLNKISSIRSYRLILTKLQMRELAEIYAYQEGGYTIKLIEDEIYKIYLVGDFVQKQLGLKDAINYYDFPLKMEIVKGYGLYDSLYYSDHFIENAATVTEFETKYPKWGLNFAPVSDTEIYTLNSYLGFNENRGIYQDLRNYSSDSFTLDIIDIERPYDSGNNIMLKLCPYPEVTNPSILFTFGYTHPFSNAYRLRVLKNYAEIYNATISSGSTVNYDLRIQKNAANVKVYWRVNESALWTKVADTNYSPNWSADYMRIDASLSDGSKLELNQVLFTPDEVR